MEMGALCGRRGGKVPAAPTASPVPDGAAAGAVRVPSRCAPSVSSAWVRPVEEEVEELRLQMVQLLSGPLLALYVGVSPRSTAERRHATGRERINTPTLWTLQASILLLPWWRLSKP